MNVLIINLTRFGDLLQTQPVISGFRAQGASVGLVCVENFASAAGLLRDVDDVFSFSGARILAALDANWREAVDISEKLAAKAREFAPDLVVNLTPSVSSRLLARRLSGGAPVQGFGIDAQGFNADSSPWAEFLQVAGGNRGASPFNMCDLFRRTAGLTDSGRDLKLADLDPSALSEADELLAQARADGMTGFVAFQPGASEDRRRWPVARFRELGKKLWEGHQLVPVILGTGGEAELGKRILEGGAFPGISLQGKTSLPVLAAVLSRCDGIVSNDTGTMHLAAGMGTPVASIFLATAQPWDTGPYRAGSVCLEPDMECHPCRFGEVCHKDGECRNAVSVQAAESALLAAMGREGGKYPGARAWRTLFDEDGFMRLESLSGHEDAFRSRWICIQRELYRRFLDGDPLDGARDRCARLEESDRESLLRSIASGTNLLFLLARQAELLAHDPRQALKSKFLAGWERFHHVLQSDARLGVVGELWNFESHQYGGDLAALSRLIARYHALLQAFSQCI
ncbi:glycosyltransferase family 9 protein [Desulfovibrio oxyclinae]|uniref:glycosyltransferase family 9 protein n=1 Tax=Desulfovibrio oxyclinae TaxID=63560 RepID=UPI0003700208|nr:glycosyltransferase family 9 protein [Desulfovibrio oxyclinae]